MVGVLTVFLVVAGFGLLSVSVLLQAPGCQLKLGNRVYRFPFRGPLNSIAVEVWALGPRKLVYLKSQHVK